jgi:hypothetical membrane protein
MATQQSSISNQTRTGDHVDERVDLSIPGVLLFFVGASFLIVTMLAASIAPSYDFGGGAISDLGVIAETAGLFNGLLIAIGALNLLAGSLLYRAHAKVWILAVFVVAGVGAAGAGLMPLDSGAPHSIFALLGFLFFNIEALAVAAILAGPMRLLSLLAGALGLVFVVLMVIGDSGNVAAFGPIGHGGTERMIVYPVMSWLMALGGYLMAPGPQRIDRQSTSKAR